MVVQNLLGASMGPIVMGGISDARDIQSAFKILPIALIIAAILFFIGSFFYKKDLRKVTRVELEAIE